MEQAHEYRPGYNPKFLAAVKRKREAERAAAAREEARLIHKQRVRSALRVVEPTPEYVTIVVRELPSGKKVIRDLVSSVAADHGLTYDDIVGRRLARPVTNARHASIRVVADARPDMSVASLARIFNRDHTSLLYALSKTRKPGQVR